MDGQDVKPTLKTIAFMTGLAVASVSKALKDAPDISQKTKDRVRLIAQQIGYEPDPAGIRLRTGRTKVIAVVLSIDEDRVGFSSQFVFGISEALRSTGYNMMVMPHTLQNDGLSSVRYLVDNKIADGIIIARIEPHDARVRFLSDRGVAFSTHGRSSMGIEHPFADFDNHAFAYQAVELLARRDRRRIAIIAPPQNLSYFDHIRSGFRSAMNAFALPEAAMWSHTDTPLRDAYQEFETLLRSSEPPDALICCAGGTAIAANAALLAAGRTLGKDFDMVAKQSFELLHWIDPNIIIAQEDLRTSGRDVAELVLARIAGEDPAMLKRLTQPRWLDNNSLQHLKEPT